MERISVKNFVEDFLNKKIMNSKVAPNAVEDYINNTLEIRRYIPFRDRRSIVEALVNSNITENDGIKHYDSINGYVSFVITMITVHTNLEFNSEDPVDDYDLLAENKLLSYVISEFQGSYDECDVLLKLALASALEDNNVNVLVGKFLNGILDRLDSVGNVLQDKFGDINVKDIIGENFKEEDMTKLIGFLNK